MTGTEKKACSRGILRISTMGGPHCQTYPIAECCSSSQPANSHISFIYYHNRLCLIKMLYSGPRAMSTITRFHLTKIFIKDVGTFYLVCFGKCYSWEQHYLDQKKKHITLIYNTFQNILFKRTEKTHT